MTFAEFLKEQRVKLGLSQNQLGRKLGYNDGQFVSNWERGMVKVPVKKIYNLSFILKINIDLMMKEFEKDTLAQIRKKMGT